MTNLLRGLKVLQKRDIKILSCLREDARASITKIAKKTQLPISTVYERIQFHRKNTVYKFSALLDFTKFGYMAKALVLFKINKKDKKKVRDYFIEHQSVNSVYRVSNGNDYMVEIIFRDIKEIEDFLDEVEEEFRVRNKEVHYLIEDLKKEEFMPELGS